jgi:hypothetical protein
MKRTKIAFLFVIGFGRCAIADDVERTAVLDQLQAQFSACAAFYTIELDCLAGGESRRRLAAVSRRADALAAVISMSNADAALRLELNLAAGRSLMQDGCRSITTLEDRYASDCDPLSSGRE